ncbi:MAG: D-aminopeptidase, partial [Actinomycetota bacterium]|nr:D-aminopeptidase [Actinomycetota bacterium]
GGTGMNCYGFKGGSGTSSRKVSYGTAEYTVGALVQANFGARSELTIAGVAMGHLLPEDNPLEDVDWLARDRARGSGFASTSSAPHVPGAGSVIVIVATDAPLLPGQCKALARRVPLGLARTGTAGGHFSGDIFLAFSTANSGALRSGIAGIDPADDEYDTLRFVPWGRMDGFFTAVVEVVEEAVLNALVVNSEMVGRDGHRTPALPLDRVRQALQRTDAS